MSLKHKLKVIKSAEENNNSAADRHFAVSEKLVRDWRKQKKYLFEMPRMKRAKRYGVSPYIKLETALNDWVLEYRHNGYIVTKMMIWIQAVKLTRDKQYEIFMGNALPKLRMLQTGTAMVITMMILLLHVRFRITTGSAFLQMMTTIQILNQYHKISEKHSFGV